MGNMTRFDPKKTLRIPKAGGITVQMKVRQTEPVRGDQTGLSWGRLLRTLQDDQVPQPRVFGFEVSPPQPMNRPSA